MDGELIQRLVALAIVAAAAAFLVARAWRKRRPRSTAGCDADCGCGH